MSEINVGAAIPEYPVRVDPEPMKVFSLLTADPNPIHWDVDAVRAAQLGDRVVNQGGLNVSYVASAVTAWAGSPTALQMLRVRFAGNVFAGDTVTAGGEITAVRELASRSEVDLQVWLRGPDGTEVLTGTATAVVPPAESSA